MSDGADDPEGQRSGRGARLATWADRNLVLVALAVLVFVLGAAAQIVNTVAGAVDYFRSNTWQEVEQRKLDQLRAGATAEWFRAQLGPPFSSRRGTVEPVEGHPFSEVGLWAIEGHQPFEELVFRGRGWWVQVLVDQAGVVAQFALTACDPYFTPEISIPTDARRIRIGAHSIADAQRGLRESTTAGPVEGAPSVAHVVARIHSVTANAFYFEVDYLGNPGGYRTVAFGSNDVCGRWRAVPTDSPFRVGLQWAEPPYDDRFGGDLDREVRVSRDPELQAFRAQLLANTYVETASGLPFIAPWDFPGSIGVDRTEVPVPAQGPWPLG